jgi:hypothetical protein
MAFTTADRDIARQTRSDLSQSPTGIWSTICAATRAAAIIAALMLVALSPIALRLWLFFPTIHG